MQAPSHQQQEEVQGSEDIGATQVQDNPPLPLFVPTQSEEEESQQVSIPPMQEEPTSPSASTKQKKIKI